MNLLIDVAHGFARLRGTVALSPKSSLPSDVVCLTALGGCRRRSVCGPSGHNRPGGPADFSPRREPWETGNTRFPRAPEGRKNSGITEILSPLRGWVLSLSHLLSHGLRHGLKSFAPSGGCQASTHAPGLCRGPFAGRNRQTHGIKAMPWLALDKADDVIDALLAARRRRGFRGRSG